MVNNSMWFDQKMQMSEDGRPPPRLQPRGLTSVLQTRDCSATTDT